MRGLGQQLGRSQRRPDRRNVVGKVRLASADHPPGEPALHQRPMPEAPERMGAVWNRIRPPLAGVPCATGRSQFLSVKV